jgi:type II secretory ATPase GspE/PulE/Tfp pilus assembly ATPase PilB-like protein
MAQRLVRRLAEGKEKYFLTDHQIKEISKYCDLERVLKILKEEKIVPPKVQWDQIPFYRPKPTKEAPDGYRGRIGIFETLPVTETIKNLIVKKATSDEIQEQAKKEGMVLMVEDGLVKAAQGITSIEEVLRVIIE